ncbi:hypothetical protein BN8_05185 [Fibrisoma limi BUZ 3]|uniref:Uncharacterized protein n=1 Tax=Fibrisoma limi BUZ 3 TaxID=1185876 RepID=I2GPR0_9BACT|nr:hypothetical protein [Fibrisoma limi]CCH55888.1 hypothetical protein BN8_05185 [Fibrisoma limi BUZ 3]
MEAIETAALQKIDEARDYIVKYACELPGLLSGINLPIPSSRDENIGKTECSKAEYKAITGLQFRQDVLHGLSMKIACEVNCIIEDVCLEINENAIRMLGKERRKAYAAKCENAFNSFSEARSRLYVHSGDLVKNLENNSQLPQIITLNEDQGKFIPIGDTKYGKKVSEIVNEVLSDAQLATEILEEQFIKLKHSIEKNLPVKLKDELAEDISTNYSTTNQSAEESQKITDEKGTITDILSGASTEKEPDNGVDKNKLIWNCKPAIAGFIISELIRAGYIEPPITNGELSLTKLANICNSSFRFTKYNPSPNSWRNVVDTERNTLSEANRTKLTLPDLDQLS